MKTGKSFSLCLLILFISAFAKNNMMTSLPKMMPQEDSLIAKGATLQLVSNQFSFTEGSSVDKKGNVFFTDQPNDKIWKYDVKGKLSVFLEKTGRSNGTYFDPKGNLLT
jgi:gluconolactonase